MLTNQEIGVQLQRLRESHNMSLGDLSRVIGKHRSTIHLYENGSVSISIPILKSILSVYGVNVGRFLDGIESHV